MIYTRIDLSTYIVISIWFGCNNDCTICMLSGMKSHLPAIGFNQFKEALIDIRNEGRFENLILSGAEVTTCGDVEQYIRYASSLGWFKKIQIQTNGRRLADKTKHNYQDVAPLMNHLCHTKASEIHLWNFYPMERTDTRDFIVGMQDFVALLRRILPTFEAARKPLILKSFPECLTTGEPGFFDSLYPVTILPDQFWRKFDESGFGMCYYPQNGACSNRACWGLSSAYIHKYGDERELLSPN